MARSRNDANRQKSEEESKKRPKPKKEAKVKKRHGDVGVPLYNKAQAEIVKLLKKVDSGEIQMGDMVEMMTLPVDFPGTAKFFEISGAVFRTEKGGFIKTNDDGSKETIKFVEIHLHSKPEAPHVLAALPESALQYNVTPSQVRKNETSRPTYMDDRSFAYKSAICDFLHQEYIKVEADVQKIYDDRKAKRQAERLADYLAYQTEQERTRIVEEQKRQFEAQASKASSNVRDFAGGKDGFYGFPRTGPRAFFEMKDGKIRPTCIEEGNPLYGNCVPGQYFLLHWTLSEKKFPEFLPEQARPHSHNLYAMWRALRTFLVAYNLDGFVPKKEKKWIRKGGDKGEKPNDTPLPAKSFEVLQISVVQH